MPLFHWNVSTPPTVFGAMCIFRPDAERVGVMMAGNQRLVESVKTSGMVVAALELVM